MESSVMVRTPAIPLACLIALLLVALSPRVADARDRAAGAPVLSDDAAAAQVQRTGWEPRPENTDENNRTPTRRELRAFFARNKTWGSCHRRLQRRITGDFTGTTDEILQWAAHKWGFEVDLVRAVAITESFWRMSFVGDRGDSFGIVQVRRSAHRGTFPIARRSTAFNVDYWGAHIRQYLDGCASWMRHRRHGRGEYRSGDLWGSIGAWYCGCWRVGNAFSYIGRVKRAMATRPWEGPDF
jgi:hypothetical protein